MEAKRDLIVAVDAGTTGTRCCIMDAAGTIVASGYCPMPTFYPKPGLVEQDPNDLINLTFKAVRTAVESAGVGPVRFAGLCITVQRNSFVPVDARGGFLCNLLTWQDQRGEAVHPWMMECLRDHGMTVEDLYRRNGQPFASFQYGYKMLWIRHFQQEMYQKTWRLLTPLAFLTHAFGAEGYTEENNNQSFWLVADADAQKIDPELCRIFDVRPDIFPETADPGTQVGVVSRAAAERSGLPEGLPIYLGSGDQQCGTLGAGNYGTTDIVTVCMGTAGLCIAYSPRPIRHPRGMCQIQGHPAGGYLIETHSSSCMSSYRWAEKMLFADADGRHALAEAAQRAPVGAHGVFFLPWLQGAACPHYNDAARGAFIGMSLANDKGDMARATMEGICFENRMMLETLREADLPPVRSLRLLGGAANNDFWDQMQADIYGLPVETVTASEVTALGAAIIGATAAGMYSSIEEASHNMTHVLKRYMPREESVRAYDEVYSIWDSCYSGLSQTSFQRIFDYQQAGGPRQ